MNFSGQRVTEAALKLYPTALLSFASFSLTNERAPSFLHSLLGESTSTSTILIVCMSDRLRKSLAETSLFFGPKELPLFCVQDTHVHWFWSVTISEAELFHSIQPRSSTLFYL